MVRRAEFTPGKRSFIVGVSGLMTRLDIGEWSAKRMLREWWQEEQDGGNPVCRVFRRPHGTHFEYFTTELELHRGMPAVRDMKLLRKMQELENDLTVQARRVDRMTYEIKDLVKLVKKLELRR